MARINSHDDLVVVTINLADPAGSFSGFSKTLMIADDAPVSARVIEYANLAAVQAAFDASDVTQAVLDAATAYFGQQQAPDGFLVGKRVSASETWVEALDLIIAENSDFYGLIIESRTAADIKAIGDDVESKRAANGQLILFIAQSADADWKTPGFPASMASLEDTEGTVICYHETDTENMDAAYAGSRLGFDPDEQSVPWNTALEGVANYPTAVTAAEKTNLTANGVNFGLPFYAAADFYVDPGRNTASRPIYEIVSADWFKIRLEENTAQLIVDLSDRGQKLPVNTTGQSQILALVRGLFDQGVVAQHFEAGQTNVRAESITPDDVANERLRFTGEAQLLRSARKITYTFDFTPNPVNV